MSSASASTAFLAWLGDHCGRGERLLVGDLGDSPRWFFEQKTSGYINEFYGRIDRWSSWRLELIAGLRRRLIDADHLVSAAEERFATDRLLRFRVRLAQNPDKLIPVDLKHRDWYLDGAGWNAIRTLLMRGREEPAWNIVKQNIAVDIRRFREMVTSQHDQLVLAGEPRTPSLQDALARLASLSYVDVGLVKTDVIAAEAHFRTGQPKDAGSAFRRAIEQVVKDSYRESLSRAGATPPPTFPNTRDQATAIGRALASKASAHHVYGAYALLSELGSHTGPLDPEELDAMWHSAVAALLIFAKRLKT